MLTRMKVLPSVAQLLARRYLGDAPRVATTCRHRGYGGVRHVSTSRIRVWLARQFGATVDENHDSSSPISAVVINPVLQSAISPDPVNSQAASDSSRRKGAQNTIRRLTRAVRKGRLEDAERLLAEIAHDEEMELDVKLCNYALHSCASAKDATRAQTLLAIMKKKNIQLDSISYGCLLRSFCRAGALDKAMKVLEGLVREYQLGLSGVTPNGIMFNTVLNGCATVKNRALAERCLELMNIVNIPKDDVTYTELMKLEGVLRSEEGIERWWKELQQLSAHPTPYVHTARIVAICRSRDVAAAERALMEMVESVTDAHRGRVNEAGMEAAEPVVEHNIDAFVGGGPYDSAKLRDEKDGEDDAIVHTEHAVLDAAVLRDHEEMKGAAEQWLDHAASSSLRGNEGQEMSPSNGSWQQRGDDPMVNQDSACLNNFEKKNLEEKAVGGWKWWEGPLPELMDRQTRRLLSQAYNAVINCAYHNGRTDLAERFYAEMRQGGLEPDIYTFNALLRAVGRGRGYGDAKRVMKSFEMVGIRPDQYSIAAMIETLCKEGNINQAEVLLNRLQEYGNPTCFTYNRVIDACTAKGDPVRALQIFAKMKNHGVAPDEYTYVSLFSAFGRAHVSGVVGGSWSRTEVGKRVLALEEDMEKSGVKHTRATFSALVHTLGHEGMLDAMLNRIYSVQDLMDASGRPFLSTLTCNIAINACVQAKQVELALDIFGKMEGWGCDPDLVTYNTLINSCSYNQNLPTAFELMDSMKKKGIPPDIISYNSLIKVTCHCNKLDLALALLQEMSALGIKPDTFTFHTLLASATYHRLDVIEFVIEHMRREGVKPGLFTCALVATAYLELERLDEVVESMKVLSARMIASPPHSSKDGEDAADTNDMPNPGVSDQRITVMSESEAQPRTAYEETDEDGVPDGVGVNDDMQNDGLGNVETDDNCAETDMESPEAELDTRHLLEDAVLSGSEEAVGRYLAKLTALLDGEYTFLEKSDDKTKMSAEVLGSSSLAVNAAYQHLCAVDAVYFMLFSLAARQQKPVQVAVEMDSTRSGSGRNRHCSHQAPTCTAVDPPRRLR
ncbi:hypothetical protein CBR_g11913 [Chara braunii]|uniref:Pentacotripeptide-repeat region of PRORP domain-containing protein n=1 Tax=Chara braunii TaxID=69332 RepID=A0A388KQL3_CHABU|nr:hypothetical protein CBR_g11913 [Chara braunii]|eukprot:GBG72335.1 hypothetical protein CBR_g11913 [Chara braunii]